MPSYDFAKIIEEIQNFKVPQRFEKFLIRGEPASHSEQTLEYYGFAYEQAFNTLAERSLDRWHSGGFLTLPLFYLARHSIELSLKRAIAGFAEYTREDPPDCGHSLMRLWNELKRQFGVAKMPEIDEWCRHV